MWRRRERDPMQVHGLRPLTWRDRLCWERARDVVVGATPWSAVVLWLLLRYTDIGPITVLVVVWLGLLGSAAAMMDDRNETDISRWPRREVG